MVLAKLGDFCSGLSWIIDSEIVVANVPLGQLQLQDQRVYN